MQKNQNRKRHQQHTKEAGDTAHQYCTRRARHIARITPHIKGFQGIAAHTGRQEIAERNAYKIEARQARHIRANVFCLHKSMPEVGAKDYPQGAQAETNEQIGQMYMREYADYLGPGNSSQDQHNECQGYDNTQDKCQPLTKAFFLLRHADSNRWCGYLDTRHISRSEFSRLQCVSHRKMSIARYIAPRHRFNFRGDFNKRGALSIDKTL